MLFDNLAHQLVSSYSTDPLQLNNEFKKGIYTPDGMGNIDPKKVPNYIHDRFGLSVTNIESDPDPVAIQKLLCANTPVILRMRMGSGSHFVLATGSMMVDNTLDFAINDPLYGETTLNTKRYSFNQFRYYKISPPIQLPMPALRFIISFPAHILVTDPQGRRSGFDPQTASELSEIPGSYYSTESIGTPDGTTTGEDAFLEITNPTDGGYTIQAIGYGSGSYIFGVTKMNANGYSVQETFTGLATLTSTTTFQTDYSPELGKVYLPTAIR
jgi:hypothetical protein